jgi:cytoskeletal protein RodZ
MKGILAIKIARTKAVALWILGLWVVVMVFANCGDEKTDTPQPEVSKAAQPDPTPEPPVEEELTPQEQKNLTVSYTAQATEEINEENAESVADALEKEIEADLE